MFRKNVTSNQTQYRRRQSSGERRGFGRTAGNTMSANLQTGRPKRGGIRL